jgi:hypothetical protein
MRPNAIVELFKEAGHSLTVVDGQIKVVSQRRLAPDLLELVRAGKSAVIQHLEWKVMSEAIEAVEAVYCSGIERAYSEQHAIEAARLSAMTILSIDDVNRWKTGWLRLIESAKRAKHVS